MKKLWVSVKRGYIRDPKHRRAVGECTWLFQYMLDIADWNTGIISEWKDEAAAEDMEMPIRTLREQRRKLDELGYITCRQKQYGQDIVIHNWTNPRDYSGSISNPKQGDSETEAQENTQGYIQDDIQGSSQDVTPTYKPKNHKSIKDKADKPPTPPEILLYREVVSKYPNKGAWDEVVTAVQKVSARLHRPAEAADLQPFFKAWCTKSGNLYNFSVWLLEWAVNGTMAQGYNKPAQEKEPAGFDAIREWAKDKGINYGN